MSKNNDQQTLFDMGNSWDEEWKDMPEFHQDDQKPWKSVIVHFKCRSDYLEFVKRMDQRMTEQTKSIWFPEDELSDIKDYWWEGGHK